MVGVPGHHGLAVASLVAVEFKRGHALVPGRARLMVGGHALDRAVKGRVVIRTPVQVRVVIRTPVQVRDVIHTLLVQIGVVTYPHPIQANCVYYNNSCVNVLFRLHVMVRETSETTAATAA